MKRFIHQAKPAHARSMGQPNQTHATRQKTPPRVTYRSLVAASSASLRSRSGWFATSSHSPWQQLADHRFLTGSIQCVPINELWRQPVGFGVEAVIGQIDGAEAQAADGGQVFARHISHCEIEIILKSGSWGHVILQ